MFQTFFHVFLVLLFLSKKLCLGDQKTHFYVYELLSNVYKRSFIEIHANFCDLMNQDTLFSRAIKSTDYKAFTQCPVPPGDYILANMTAPYGPFLKTFPFKQGRVYVNLTTKSNKVIGSMYTDIKITELNAKDFYKYIKL